MKNLYLFGTRFAVFLLLTSYCAVSAQNALLNKDEKSYQILYFNPEVFPNIEEIKEPTYTAFFSALSDHMSTSKNNKLLRVDYDIPYDEPEAASIAEFCTNNNAQYAVVSKVKYFKVGFGKYVFSNQVVVSMKIYNAAGELMAESSYDTYRKNGRLLGSAENSIKIGTNGALKNLSKNLRKQNRSTMNASTEFEIFPTEQFSLN